MNASTPMPQKSKTPYRGFEKKERMIPSILISLALPFTLLFFGPFEMFYANYSQLYFAFGDFIWPLFFIALGASVCLFLLLLHLKGRAFDIVYGVLLGLLVMIFLQGSFLNLGLTSLPGDGVGVSSFSKGATVINTVVWVLVLAAIPTALSLLGKWRDVARLVMMVLTVAVIGGQLINFAVYAMASPVLLSPAERSEIAEGEEDAEEKSDHASGERAILTTKNLTTLSTDGNVILFIVDRFDLDFYHYAQNKHPELFSELEGFTSFENNISKYARTYPSMAFLLTGVENTFETSTAAYFKNAYTDAPFFKTLKENGYDINLYMASGDCYDDASVFSDVVDNTSAAKGYTILDRGQLCSTMLRLSLFRQLPIVFKGVVGNISTATFSSFVEYEADYPLYTSDMKEVYELLSAEDFKLEDGNKRFVTLHIDGCHYPFIYDENWEALEEGDPRNNYSTAEMGMISSFAIINRYLGEMKRLGVYDDATIVITGDHAAAYSDTKDLSGSRLTALLVKEKGSSEGMTAVNRAPVSQDDLRATILDSEGIAGNDDFGRSAFDVRDDDDGKRYYYFQKTIVGADDEIVVYEVVGDASDFSNWTLVDRITVTGDLT